MESVKPFHVELSLLFKFDVPLIKRAFQTEDSDQESESISPKVVQKNKGEWEWSDDEDKNGKKNDIVQEFLDTKKMLATMSRSQNILAVAKHRHFVIIQNGKDYNIVDSACDPDDDRYLLYPFLNQSISDKITQILMIPFLNRGITLIHAIAVGTHSGFLKIYSPSGHLLISQQLHKSPIQKLKLRTSPTITGYFLSFLPFQPTSSPLQQQTEDMSILFKDLVLVCIDGISLHSLLQSCLFQLETNKEFGNDTLAYRKWKLEDQTVISDITSVGMCVINIGG